jgi:hypothetical protein
MSLKFKFKPGLNHLTFKPGHCSPGPPVGAFPLPWSKRACARAARWSRRPPTIASPGLLPVGRRRPRCAGPLPNPHHLAPPPYCPQPPSLLYPTASFKKHPLPRSPSFPPRALFSSAKEPRDTPRASPLHLLRRRSPESHRRTRIV